MLQAGERLEVIAHWLGHEKLDTAHQYLEPNLAMKEKALQALDLPKTKNLRFQPTDRLLRFLDSLRLWRVTRSLRCPSTPSSTSENETSLAQLSIIRISA
jgi:hypothetical protein